MPPLIDVLTQSDVDAHDVLHIVEDMFSTAVGLEDGRVAYPMQEPFALIIKADDATIVSAEAGPALTESTLSELDARIKSELSTSPGDTIHRVICFHSGPILGSWRSPMFQIMPAPDSAPKPPSFVGDYPFVIELPVRRSNSGFITYTRRDRVATELAALLNLWITGRIQPRTNRPRHMWATCLADGFPPTTKWVQEYYEVSGFVYEQAEFSPSSHTLIEQVSADDYYSTPFLRGAGEKLVVPSNLNELHATYLSLAPKDRDKYMRAALWFDVAADLFAVSQTAYYAALIAAIDSVVPKAGPPDRCETCLRDKQPGPTRRFENFVEKHAAGTSLAPDKRRLYDVRSRIAHGDLLFQSDRVPWTMSFNSSALGESDLIRRAARLVQLVLVRWLTEQAR